MTHTSPRPIRLRYHSDDLATDVLRGVGFEITCPKCGEKQRGATWGKLRQWLGDHVRAEHLPG